VLVHEDVVREDLLLEPGDRDDGDDGSAYCFKLFWSRPRKSARLT
jgi:hypothetical protein